MTLDLNRYRKNITLVCKAYAEREPHIPKHLLCGRIAAATDCPIIAVGYYMSEIYGMNDELRGFLDRAQARSGVNVIGRLAEITHGKI